MGEFVGPMQEIGMEFKHLGIVPLLEILGNLVFLIPMNPKHA